MRSLVGVMLRLGLAILLLLSLTACSDGPVVLGEGSCNAGEHRDYGGPPYFETPEEGLEWVRDNESDVFIAPVDEYSKETRGDELVVFTHEGEDPHYLEFYRHERKWAFGSRTGCG